MNTVFKILMFSIMLNLSIGIMMNAIPAFTNDPSTRGGLGYDDGYSDDFVLGMEKNISPTGELENKGDAIYRILDMLNLGFIQRFLGLIKQYIYGFVYLLDIIIGVHLDPGLRNFLFYYPIGVFYTLMNIGYILGAWVLWTGKDVND